MVISEQTRKQQNQDKRNGKKNYTDTSIDKLVWLNNKRPEHG